MYVPAVRPEEYNETKRRGFRDADALATSGVEALCSICRKPGSLSL